VGPGFPGAIVPAVAGKGTPATAALARAKVAHRIHEYAHRDGQAYGAEAAEVPVSATLDLKALAAAVGGKRARMAEIAAAERATGYVAGGISPLGQRKRLPAVLDASAEGFETVFCSAGRRGLEVELAPADLVRLTGGRVAPIAT
jgi:Cys-tRNA(Pro)/Cys-tRNA(Cys) deacylase